MENERKKVRLELVEGSSSKYYEIFVRQSGMGASWEVVGHHAKIGNSPNVANIASGLMSREIALGTAMWQMQTKLNKGYKVVFGSLE